MRHIFVLFFALVATFAIIEAKSSEPICSYKSSSGETVFLKYLPLLKRGEDYVDFDPNGKCVQRASCSETFKTEVEPCSKYKVTCGNKKSYTGVFPACCVKC